MNSFPRPAIAAALAALLVFPFSLAAAGTLLLTAALGSVIHLDYVQRHQRIRLPRLAAAARTVCPAGASCPTPFCAETHQLAA